MRKLKLQMQLSVDSFVADPNGELDWMIWDWDDELKNHVRRLTEPVDLILMGRKMAKGFIDAWNGLLDDSESGEFAHKMIDTPKIVFSKTLEKTDWVNTDIFGGGLVDKLNELKNRDGGDIVAYGGAEFAGSLVKNMLIDEYHLFVNPVALGRGLTIFDGLDKPLNLRLVESRSFSCGITGLFYVPK